MPGSVRPDRVGALICASHPYDAPAIIGLDELDLMQCDAFVINVARAALVDTAAMTAAIRAGAVRGYAVDDVVLDPTADGDLLAEGRVLQTARSAWWRDEVLDRGRRMWAHHLLAVIEGRPLDAVTWSDGFAARNGSHRAPDGWEQVVDNDDELVVAP